MVVATESLSGLNAKQLRELTRDLTAQVVSRDQAINERDPQINERNVHINALDQQINRSTAWTKPSPARTARFCIAEPRSTSSPMRWLCSNVESLAVAASNSMPAKPVCSMKRLMPTSSPLSKNFRTWHHQTKQLERPSSNPSAQPCRQS